MDFWGDKYSTLSQPFTLNILYNQYCLKDSPPCQGRAGGLERAMYRRRYPFGWTWRDFDEMMSEMENRFFGPSGRLLPPGGITDRMMPALRGEFRVDIRDHADEIIVVADLPGAEKKDVSVSLVNPKMLEIRSERNAETA